MGEQQVVEATMEVCEQEVVLVKVVVLVTLQRALLVIDSDKSCAPMRYLNYGFTSSFLTECAVRI